MINALLSKKKITHASVAEAKAQIPTYKMPIVPKHEVKKPESKPEPALSKEEIKR